MANMLHTTEVSFSVDTSPSMPPPPHPPPSMPLPPRPQNIAARYITVAESYPRAPSQSEEAAAGGRVYARDILGYRAQIYDNITALYPEPQPHFQRAMLRPERLANTDPPFDFTHPTNPWRNPIPAQISPYPPPFTGYRVQILTEASTPIYGPTVFRAIALLIHDGIPETTLRLLVGVEQETMVEALRGLAEQSAEMIRLAPHLRINATVNLVARRR